MIPVPPAWQRLADTIDGWLDLRCPDKALARLQPLLDDAAARPAALTMRIRARCRLGEYAAALPDLAELRAGGHLPEWVALTEAWCQRRLGNLPAAVHGLQQLLQRSPRCDLAHFNLSCYLALQGERDAAIDALTLACGLLPAHRDHAREEPDLDSLRTDARFRSLVRGSEPHAQPPPPISDEEPDDDDDFDFDRPAAPGMN